MIIENIIMKNKLIPFNRIIFLALFLFSNSFLIKGQNIPREISQSELSIGKTVTLYSEVLQEKRTLNIYLPLNYQQDSLNNYPVIYLLDGSMDEDFIHIAGLVQFGSFPWINMVPESIVVGIANVDRKRDFTYPTNNKQDKKDFPTTGGSASFIDFIEKELQPFIENNYRTEDNKTIIGQSLGGLLASEILFKKSNLFDHYIIVSPSLWWDDESLLNEELAIDEKISSIYVAVGHEGSIMERVARELYDKIKAIKSKDTPLFFKYLAEQDHGDALHLAVYHAFENIFKGN